ncbi:hypothetical protein [Thermococcus sp.]|nr:hypothetical protein [Thermococcus sp.]
MQAWVKKFRKANEKVKQHGLLVCILGMYAPIELGSLDEIK